MSDYQYYIRFNPLKNEFCTTGRGRVIFWSWNQGEKGFEFYSPATFEKQKQRIFT